MAKVIQLHDKFTEEIIGTILVTEKNTEEIICDTWLEFQKYNNSNSETEPDIWDFVNEYPKMDMEVVEVEFYQP